MNVDHAALEEAFANRVKARFGAVNVKMLDGLLACLSDALREAAGPEALTSAMDAEAFASNYADGLNESSLDLHIRASALAAARRLSADDEQGYVECLLEAERERRPDLGDDDEYVGSELERDLVGGDALHRIALDRLTGGGVLVGDFSEDEYLDAIRAAARKSGLTGSRLR